MPHKPTVVEVVDKLVALGTSEQIAQFFESEGVTGARRNTYACVISNYVRDQVGAHRVNTSTYAICAFSSNPDAVGLGGVNLYGVDHAPVIDFISNFDGGRYPALEG